MLSLLGNGHLNRAKSLCSFSSFLRAFASEAFLKGAKEAACANAEQIREQVNAKALQFADQV